MTKKWCIQKLREKRLLYIKAYYYHNAIQKTLIEYEMNMLLEVLKSIDEEDTY